MIILFRAVSYVLARSIWVILIPDRVSIFNILVLDAWKKWTNFETDFKIHSLRFWWYIAADLAPLGGYMVLLSDWCPAFEIIKLPQSSGSVIFEFSLYRPCYDYILQTFFRLTTPHEDTRRWLLFPEVFRSRLAVNMFCGRPRKRTKECLIGAGSFWSDSAFIYFRAADENLCLYHDLYGITAIYILR